MPISDLLDKTFRSGYINILKSDISRLREENGKLKEELRVFVPQPISKAEQLREEIFDNYGFTGFAKIFIRSFSTVELLDDSTNFGGGGWRYWDNTVIFNTKSHEAALHELSHAWQWAMRAVYPDLYRYGIVREIVHYSTDIAWAGTEFQSFCKVYVNGSPDTGFEGMLPGVKDVWNITQEEWNNNVIDWEVYAGISSWCMLQYRNGPRALPQGMWKYFEKQGTGYLKGKPYYQGGPK